MEFYEFLRRTINAELFEFGSGSAPRDLLSRFVHFSNEAVDFMEFRGRGQEIGGSAGDAGELECRYKPDTFRSLSPLLWEAILSTKAIVGFT